MLGANEFYIERCFTVQIVHKHGVMYVTSELKKMACIATSPPTTTITSTMPVLDFFNFLDVQKLAYIKTNQTSFYPLTSVGNS